LAIDFGKNMKAEVKADDSSSIDGELSEEGFIDNSILLPDGTI
jgi:hypothetical protein